MEKFLRYIELSNWPPVGGAKDRGIASHRNSHFCVGKTHTVKMLGTSFRLAGPCCATVRRAKNGSARAHCRAEVRVGEENICQTICCPAYLSRPCRPAVSRVKDHTVTSNHSCSICISEIYSGKRSRRSTRLNSPFCAPFVVRRIVPPFPTTVPVLASMKQTPRRMFVVPLHCWLHVVPPSVV